MNGSSKEKFNIEEFSKHNPETGKFIKFYALVQFLCMTYAAVVIFPSNSLEYYQGVILLSVVSFSMYCTAKWLDAERILILEYLRLTMIFGCVVYLYFISPQMLLLYVLFTYLIINIVFLPFLRKAI